MNTVRERPSIPRQSFANAAARTALACLLIALACPIVRAQMDDTGGAEIAPVVIVPHQHVYHLPSRLRTTDFARAVIESVETKIDIVDQVATTHTELRIRNPGAAALNAEVLLPVSAEVSVKSFGYEGAAPSANLRVLPLAEARRIYQSIVAESRDPGLLEFSGCGTIRSSVFPIEAGQSLRVWLSYEQVLTADGERIDYVLPRGESLGGGATPWKLTATIRSRRPISTVYSPSHDLATVQGGANLTTVRLTDRGAREPGSFRLSYLLRQGEVSASLLAYPDAAAGGGYFLLLAGVPRRSSDSDGPQRLREVTLVLDRSGSMTGEKFGQARAGALQVLEGLKPGEAFNIVDFSSDVARFSAQSVIKDAATVAQARRYLQELSPNGGTLIHGALLDALQTPPSPNTLPLVLFLTDGLPTVGEQDERAIRDDVLKANAHKRRIFAFGVGYDVNAPLLDKLADATRGASINVLPGEDIEVAISSVFRRLEGPNLEVPRLTAVGRTGMTDTRAVRDLLPATLPDLFDGDQLVVLGRYVGAGPLRLRLEGESAGRPRTFEFEFSLARASLRNDYIPRLWATRRIAELVDHVRQLGAETSGSAVATDPRAKELVDEIVRLSTRFGVLTEYTAFLATDGTSGPQASHVDPDAPRRKALARLSERAIQVRSGAGAVNQSANIKGQLGAKTLNRMNAMLDEQMQGIEYSTVQQITDQTLFRRGNRWVDARIIASASAAAEQPEKTVDFATREYFELANQLADEGRAALMSLPGECYFEVGGKRVLVRNPEPESSGR